MTHWSVGMAGYWQSCPLVVALEPAACGVSRLISIEGRNYILSDLHEENVIRDKENQLRVIDASTAVSP